MMWHHHLHLLKALSASQLCYQGVQLLSSAPLHTETCMATTDPLPCVCAICAMNISQITSWPVSYVHVEVSLIRFRQNKGFVIFKNALKIMLLFSDRMSLPSRSTGWVPGLLATVSWAKEFTDLVGNNSSPKSHGSLKLVLRLNSQHFIMGLLHLCEKPK